MQQEVEHLKVMHAQIESSRQTAARRVREIEATIANERRGLMHELELFEERRRGFATEAAQLEADRQNYVEERNTLEAEVQSVNQMAAEAQKKSQELRQLHRQVAEARDEIDLLRGQLQEERTAQGTELERLKTLQTLVEQQRLQLLQTENRVRVRSIEDVDLLVTMPAPAPAPSPEAGAWSSGAAPTVPTAGDVQGLLGSLGLAGLLQGLATPEALGAAPTPSSQDRGVSSMPAVAAVTPAVPLAARGSSVGNEPARLRPPSGTTGHPGAPLAGAGGRPALQLLLRRRRQESSEMDLYIQEQFQFLEQQQQRLQGVGDPSAVEPMAGAPSFDPGGQPMGVAAGL